MTQLFIWQRIKLLSFLTGQINLWDLDVYWQTARDVLAGAHPYHLAYMQTSGPPLVIAPFFLIAGLKLTWARGLVTLGSILAVVMTSWLLSKPLSKIDPRLTQLGLVRIQLTLLIQLIIWLAFPTRFTLLLGQLNLGLMLATAVMLLTKSPKVTGVLAGSMAIVKTNFLILVLGFFPKKILSLIFGLGLMILVMSLTLNWLKPGYYLDYLSQRAGGYVAVSANVAQTDYYNQSLRSTLNRLNLGRYFQIIWFMSLLVGGYWLVKTGDLETGVLLSLILSPLTWSHYAVVVYPIIVLLAMRFWLNRKITHWWQWSWLFLAMIFLTIELKFLHSAPLTFWTGLLASHYFIGLISLLCLRVLEIKTILSYRNLFPKKSSPVF